MTRLASVAADAFRDNPKLRRLEMEGNPLLQPLPWGVFAANAALEELWVRRNAWTTLHPLQVYLQSHKNFESSFHNAFPPMCRFLPCPA